MPGVEPVVARLRRHLEQIDPGGGLVGLYLFGSSVSGGLRADSDIDVLLLTRRSLSCSERQALLGFLLQFSGRRATLAAGRPLEVTGLVVDDVNPWRYPPVCDFLYGEWLRDEFHGGRLPDRHTNPDVAVLITTARQHAACLYGPPLADLLPPVSLQDLHAAIHDSLDPLLADLGGDERNVLLTLARMVVTLEMERIVPKHEAAELILPSLEKRHRSLPSFAARGYVGEVTDDWRDRRQEAIQTTQALAHRIRRHRR